MQFRDLQTDSPPQGFDLEREVYILLQQYGATRLHDSLLCQAYHCIYDEWEVIEEGANHWFVAIPDDRSQERSDASIVRARREVQSKVDEPALALESYVDAAWDEDGWHQYLQERINHAITAEYGHDTLEYLEVPEMQKEQVAWLLTNHPETRGDDKKLILRWMMTWGGWRQGGTKRGKTTYAIPKAYQWQTTTPESITAARRKWHQQGLFLPDEATQQARKDLEHEVRQAFREGKSPWGVVQ